MAPFRCPYPGPPSDSHRDISAPASEDVEAPNEAPEAEEPHAGASPPQQLDEAVGVEASQPVARPARHRRRVLARVRQAFHTDPSRRAPPHPTPPHSTHPLIVATTDPGLFPLRQPDRTLHRLAPQQPRSSKQRAPGASRAWRPTRAVIWLLLSSGEWHALVGREQGLRDMPNAERDMPCCSGRRLQAHRCRRGRGSMARMLRIRSR